MNIYCYVAQSNPTMALALCHKYGYKTQGVRSGNDLGTMLEQLVQKEGEPALKDIVDNHPDRGLIIEMYENERQGDMKVMPQPQYQSYQNFTGNREMDREYPMPRSNPDTSAYMLASAFLLGIAILAVKS